jgi:hypothetical protein
MTDALSDALELALLRSLRGGVAPDVRAISARLRRDRMVVTVYRSDPTSEEDPSEEELEGEVQHWSRGLGFVPYPVPTSGRVSRPS